ncbi:hypothetical protein CASFOL_020176 [Castilleja foliolosa]|uniref:Glycoside hydrolase family 5 domain-containing protein n=1 Tax=Castilleja foliolosa TaxID=1961234 RepID=A0ABD3D2V9_9LAMI
MEGAKIETILLFLTFLQISSFCNSVPLSTSSSWIIDQSTGNRVKLACVNWASHMEPMIAEGLEKKPINYIATQIASNGFNCVRFTWATFMFTRPDYSSLTVSQSLDKYNLTAAKSGITENNPQILNMKIIDVHKAVVNELGKNNLMVVLDNHVSMPSWCCSNDDGNGFFGDPSFDPIEWLKGLIEVARTYKGNSAVVGMSLRNELRGKRQNVPNWYKYMEQGANTIHQENPDFLVIISGLSFDNNLSFLRRRPLNLNLNNKLVYEAHWYTFGIANWTAQTNKVCSVITKAARNNHLFLTTGNNPFPLFLSEFGINQGGNDEGENRFITCLLAEVAEKDIDWALWTFQGSYMIRQGNLNVEETYGVMDLNWDRPRNPAFLERLQVIRQLNQEPKSTQPTKYIIFHPQSGQCVQIDDHNKNVILANCNNASRWDQHQDGDPIKLSGSQQYLSFAYCKDCKWKYVSSLGLQLASRSGQGEYLCLEKNGLENRLVAKKCLCVTDNLVDYRTCADNPQVQWFKFVPTNV